MKKKSKHGKDFKPGKWYKRKMALYNMAHIIWAISIDFNGKNIIAVNHFKNMYFIISIFELLH